MTRAESQQKAIPTWPPRRRFVVLSATTLLVCGTVGAVLTDGAREMADLSTMDPSITSSVLATRSSFVNAVALGVTSLGSTVGLVALTLLGALWLGLRRRQWRRAGLLVLAMVGAAALTIGLKTWVGRARPPISDLISAPSNDPSFPSGHTLNSTVFFGMVAFIALRIRHEKGATGTWSWGLSLCLLAPVAVGCSRVYLGYHWATDVLAGWVFGLGYLALIVLLGCARAQRHTTPPRSQPCASGKVALGHDSPLRNPGTESIR